MFFSKTNPEKDLNHFCESLKDALGNKLHAFVLFGSHVRGGYDPKRSNLNVLVVSDLSPESLRLMSTAIKAWLKKGHVPPVLVALDELDDFARDFPIEFLDMKDSHRVLWGENPFGKLQVDVRHLEGEIEHDLALVQLRLRQAFATASGDASRLAGAVEGARSSLTALLRASLRLSGQKDPVLDRIQADFKGLTQPSAEAYLKMIDSVLTHLRKR